MPKMTDLTFAYADRPVLQRFAWEFLPDGLTALTGPSGCGKTTLLRLIAGLEKPASGSVTGLSPQESVMLFQEDRLLPWRTVRDHLTDGLPRGRNLPAVSMEDFKKHKTGKSDDWLAFAELEEEADFYPDQLSGGMARRLALTRCCITCRIVEGNLLLLDEPFTGVDRERRARLIERLRCLGIPTLLTSHEQDVLDACDRVVHLEGPPLKVL